jgi:hypothetical protein
MGFFMKKCLWRLFGFFCKKFGFLPAKVWRSLKYL